MVKIKVPLPEDNLAGAEAEWVWAEPQGDGTYVLKNVPFYAKEISCADIVRADPEEGSLVFKGVARHSGHSTYRIYASAGRTTPAVAVLLGTLRNMHCDIEPATDKLVGVDVLPEADIYADIYKVYEGLAESERAGVIDFEEGHCGHPLRTKPALRSSVPGGGDTAELPARAGARERRVPGGSADCETGGFGPRAANDHDTPSSEPNSQLPGLVNVGAVDQTA